MAWTGLRSHLQTICRHRMMYDLPRTRVVGVLFKPCTKISSSSNSSYTFSPKMGIERSEGLPQEVIYASFAQYSAHGFLAGIYQLLTPEWLQLVLVGLVTIGALKHDI